MLDFNEVARRIAMRNAAPDKNAMPHESVVAPLIGQLLDAETYGDNGTTLLTGHEGTNLGMTLQRQAHLLDHKEVEVAQLTEQNEAMQAYIVRMTKRMYIVAAGTVVVALWLSAVLVAVWLVK